ncbi:GNAT family N-acetyltransferase [Vibrio diazotrophicus]|uniref:GNAT family N-acetyltransferase n=1 Tax=Vibrio diazotrophicus TaxID=685 RepID=UPI000C9E45AE|nr:GNAT family N-acetyltransferase [Vibrio diazotrophicus]PNH92181.1 GNAT family N-acetyltransferase [Vibrio diazotrophicus]
MVTIEKYSPIREEEASLLSVLSDQTQFTVSNVPKVVEQLKETEHPHLIIFEDKAVGFFLLDLDYSEKYQFGQHRAIGVRALLVDQKYQGKGIATQAIKALPSYVTKHYPDYEAMQLTVNCRNKAAYACYLKYGFVDSGELYMGGPVGPQHIMHFSL